MLNIALPSIPSEIKPEVDSILEAIVYLYTESRRVTKEVARRVGPDGAPAHRPQDARGGRGPLALRALRAHPRAEQHGHRDHRPHGARGAGRPRALDGGPARRAHPAHREGRAGSRARSPSSRWRSSAAPSRACRPGEMRDLLKILTKIAQRVQGIVKRDVGCAGKEPEGASDHEFEPASATRTSASSPAPSPACSRTASSARTCRTRPAEIGEEAKRAYDAGATRRPHPRPQRRREPDVQPADVRAHQGRGAQALARCSSTSRRGPSSTT